MNDLPDPICSDCMAFIAEERDEQGRLKGRCHLRPELGKIPENLPYCHVFQVRRSRADKVKSPKTSRGRPQAPSRPTRPRVATLRETGAGDRDGEIDMDREGLKQVFRELLEEETLYGYPQMSKRWEEGSLVLKPADPQNQPKEIPLETFFHKIVMVRDRLRVLEAKLNSHDKLSELEKVDLQSLISKCYGTLTTFNILFADKDDQFSSK